MESVKSLEKISNEILFEAFQEAFKDYEMQLTQPELLKMLHRRGFAPHLSFGAFRDDNLVGYCIFEPGSGDNTQLAVDRGYRRVGVASLLLSKVLQSNRFDSVKAINCETDQTGFSRMMKSFGITLRGQQYEMVKQI